MLKCPRPVCVRLGALLVFLNAWVIAPARGDLPRPAKADDVALLRLDGRARALGFRTWNQHRGQHFQVVGDVAPAVLQWTSRILDPIADDFVAHFRARGFRVSLPPYWLSAVVLNDHAGFQAYLGHDLLKTEWRAEHLAGLYVNSLNCCFFFKHPPPAGRPATVFLESKDWVTWTHEATHELCYNTGLTSRWADSPKCINEGLAQYCEEHSLSRPPVIGGLDRTAVKKLAAAPRHGLTWIPLEQLLTDDEIANGRDGTERVSEFYGESWALVHLLMNRRTAAFRSYLEALPRRGPDAPKRLDVARAQLGDLSALDRELKAYAEGWLGQRIAPAPRPVAGGTRTSTTAR